MLVLHLLPLLNPGSWQQCASVHCFDSYCFAICSSELVELVLFPYCCGRSTCYSNSLLDFSVTMTRSYKDVLVNNSFPSTSKLWNFQPAECFRLTFDLNRFKSRINRPLSSLNSFYTAFLFAFNISSFFFCNSMPRSSSSALNGVNPNLKTICGMYGFICS